MIEDVANPFYSAISLAVEAVARSRGFMVIAGSCGEDPEREHELVLALLRRRVDALVLVPAAASHDWLADEETPVVFLDRPPVGVEADAVLLDNAGGARAAVEHLLAYGHRRIACVADPEELFTAAERVAGYRAALADAGIEPEPRLVRTAVRDPEHSQALGPSCSRCRRRCRPTALFTGNNRHRSARCGRCAGTSASSRSSGSTTSSWPTCWPCRRPCMRHDSAAPWAVEAAKLAFARLAGRRRCRAARGSCCRPQLVHQRFRRGSRLRDPDRAST